MLQVEERFVIHDLYRKGVSISEIARQTGHDRKTVRSLLLQPVANLAVTYRVSRKRGEASGAVKQAVAQQHEPRAPVHLPLERLQSIDVSFRLPVAPLECQSRSHRRLVR